MVRDIDPRVERQVDVEFAVDLDWASRTSMIQNSASDLSRVLVFLGGSVLTDCGARDESRAVCVATFHKTRHQVALYVFVADLVELI